MLLQQQCM